MHRDALFHATNTACCCATYELACMYTALHPPITAAQPRQARLTVSALLRRATLSDSTRRRAATSVASTLDC